VQGVDTGPVDTNALPPDLNSIFTTPPLPSYVLPSTFPPQPIVAPNAPIIAIESTLDRVNLFFMDFSFFLSHCD
jgi:hypothetical protein